MRIIIDVDGEMNKEEIDLFLKELSYEYEFIQAIKFEQSKGDLK